MKTKIKDLPESCDLVGKILYIPKSYRLANCKLLPKMIIRSGWNKGFWCVKKTNDEQIFPITFDNFETIKEWCVEK